LGGICHLFGAGGVVGELGLLLAGFDSSSFSVDEVINDMFDVV
jgi:hypothetical protein